MRIIGIFNLIKEVKNNLKNTRYAKMMNGYTPIFNSFGNDIYASDIILNALHCISTEISKLNPQHIRTDTETLLQKVVNSNLNRLLKFGPNPLMSTSDFLEKITYLYEVDKNVYIYPSFNIIPLGKNKYKREYTGLWPLKPQTVTYLEDEKGLLYIKFNFANGEDYIIRYSDIIHWRKDYGADDFIGGSNKINKSLMMLLETDNVITQGLDKGIKAGLTIRGLIKVNQMMDEKKQEEERNKFEQKLKELKNGFLAIDIKNDFIPIKMDPKMIDKDTIEFIQRRILANLNVPLKIFNGEFTEEDYQAFYEKKIEPMIISLGRCFSKLFTKRELEVGNEVIFYNQGLQFMNMRNKIDSVDIMTRLGVLTDNQVLAIFGYPPFEGGDTRNKSLNYINRDIADKYQLAKNKIKRGEENE